MLSVAVLQVAAWSASCVASPRAVTARGWTAAPRTTSPRSASRRARVPSAASQWLSSTSMVTLPRLLPARPRLHGICLSRSCFGRNLHALSPYCSLYGYHFTCCLSAYLLAYLIVHLFAFLPTCLPSCPPAFTLCSVLLQAVSLLQSVVFFSFCPACVLFTVPSSVMAVLSAVSVLQCVSFRCLPQHLL